VTIPFPLHISRLRSTAESPAGRRESASASESIGRLALDKEVIAKDRLPVITPDLTGPQVHLVLRNILDGLARDKVMAVGLYSTDTRDKLFLAREISSRLSKAMLFTMESDLLYTHPDFSGYTRGMIVASTYPLNSVTQPLLMLLRRGRPRLQFTTSMAQGLYNAGLALMYYGSPGGEFGPALSLETPPPLLDYLSDSTGSAPGSGAELPVLWISIVARDGIWPLTFIRFDNPGRAGASYVFSYPRQPAPQKGNRRKDLGGSLLHPSTPALLTLLFCFLFTLAHGFLYGVLRFHKPRPIWRTLMQRGWGQDLAGLFQNPARGSPREPQRYLMATAAPLFCASSVVLFLAAIWFYYSARVQLALARLSDASTIWIVTPWIVSIGATVVVASAPLSMLAVLAEQVRDGVLKRCRRFRWAALLIGAALTIIFLFQVAAPVRDKVMNWFAQASLDLGNGPGNRYEYWYLFFFERATNFSNWISLVVPSFLICLVLYLWGLLHLVRVSRPGACVPSRFLPELAQPFTVRLKDLHCLQLFSKSPTRGLPVKLGVVVLLLLLPQIVYGRVISVEGFTVGALLGVGVTLSEGLVVLTLVQVLYLWNLVRKILRQPVNHPMAEAFSRLPLGRTISPVSPQSPSLANLGRLVSRAQVLTSNMDVHEGLPEEERTRIQEFGSELKARLTEEVNREHRPHWVRSTTWRGLLELSTGLLPFLAAWWGSTIGKSDEKDRKAEWHSKAEEFLALEIAFVIQDYMSRIIQVLAFVVVAQLLLLLSHVFFPFKERQLQINLDFFYMFIVIASVLVILVQADKNEVLSRIASKTPGRIGLSREMLLKLFLYVVVPLVGLFTAYFPELAGTVVSWMSTFRQGVP